MKRPYVIAGLVVIADVVATAAKLQAGGLALVAVPWIVALSLSRKRPRAGAGVVVFAALSMLAITVPQLIGGSRAAVDVQFDIVNAVAAAIALVDGLRTAFGGNRVADLAGR